MRERDEEGKKHRTNTTKMREEEERERKRESSRAAHYRLYFQIAACESSPRAQIARVIEFSLLGLVFRGMARRGAFRVPTLGRTNAIVQSSIWREPAHIPSLLILSSRTMSYGIALKVLSRRIKVFGYLQTLFFREARYLRSNLKFQYNDALQ